MTSSSVKSAVSLPSTFRMTSPDLTPIFSAGEPSMGVTMTGRPSLRVTSAPMPLNDPWIDWACASASYGDMKRVCPWSPRLSSMPSIAPYIILWSSNAFSST